MRPASIRARLTLWYMLILGVLLGLFSILLYWLIARHEHSHFDYVLINYVRTAGDGFRGQLTENWGDAQGGPPHRSSLQYRPGEIVLYLPKQCLLDRKVVSS